MKNMTAKELVSKMTVEEAASQLLYVSPAIERLGIPAYNWWNEALHGVARAGIATVFPQAIGMAASFDTDLIYEVACAIADEARVKYELSQSQGERGIYHGLTFWSPNINIFRDPRWGRGQETYGEDPYLTEKMGVAFVRGLQGDDPRHLKAAACAKHFAVHSGPENSRHRFDARVSQKDLYETYLPAFKALAEAGVAGFMGAYNRVNGEPACASPTLQKILRGDWRFDGYFTSDCGALNDFHTGHKVTANAVESAALALKNGCDLNCGEAYEHILEALEQGLITDADIRVCAERLMDIRIRLGILPFEDTTGSVPDASVLCCNKHKNLNLRMARESLVLLKNNGILPLSRTKTEKVAVIGPNADSLRALVGNYNGMPDEYITVLEGIRRALPGKKVIYAKGCGLDTEKIGGEEGSGIAEAVSAANSADIVVIVTGFDESLESEERPDGERVNLLLPPAQRKLVRKVAAAGKPVIIVNMTGCCVDFEDLGDSAAAIVQAWYPGAMGGRAVAELLFGDFNPSGRLPVTFYSNDYPMPEFEDYNMSGRTYRYLAEKQPYPFGHGLSYTKYSAVFNGIGNKITVFDTVPACKVRVTNEGERDGMATVRVYSKTNLPFAEPNPVLCGFRKVFVKAGESVAFMLDLSSRAFSAIDETGAEVRAKSAVLTIEA